MQKLINSWSYNLGHRSLGLFLIRLGVGLVFLMHGWMKIQNMMMIRGFFSSLGLPSGTAEFIMLLEIVGGVALIVGVLPRLFGLLFGIEMLVSIFLTGFGKGLYQPHELEIFLMLMSFGIMFAGSGKWAIWSAECPHCGAYMCKLGPTGCPEMRK